MSHYAKLKQAIDQNNIYYYVVFSRSPVDVLRMSDHKGISSCHRLGGGKYSSDSGDYANCAIADAKNDGGIVYLIKGSDEKKIKEYLNSQDLFLDKDRNVGIIQPIGRIRLRRFIDLQSGKDFAVPTILQSEQKYGRFTSEIYEIVLDYTRNHQSIYRDPPTPEYASENIVLVGGVYSDEGLDELLNNFFGGEEYSDITHKSKTATGWQEEINSIMQKYESLKPEMNCSVSVRRSGNRRFVDLRIDSTLALNVSKYNLDGLDQIISNEFDHYHKFAKLLNLDTFTNSLWQQSTYLNGKLHIEIMASNLHDPEMLDTVFYYLEKAKNQWMVKIVNPITKYITGYLIAQQEDRE
jgi:hypothetical protein